MHPQSFLESLLLFMTKNISRLSAKLELIHCLIKAPWETFFFGSTRGKLGVDTILILIYVEHSIETWQKYEQKKNMFDVLYGNMTQ